MAKGVELGTAYLSIGASTDGMSKDIYKSLGGADKAGRKTGRSLGSSLSKGLKVGALGVAAIGTAVAGLALKGGISRALNIEDAQAKLTGLGHDMTSVQTIMDNALASVKGTAFGLGEAATSAASAVAAGIKPGQDLTRTLTLIGDAATIAGSDFGEMGAIFNKIAAGGVIQGEEIAQLGDRGIPILQLLGKELGVSALEVKKLASQGKVDFATFQNAIEAGMGGAAQKSGETFRGSLANVRAALSRLGETTASPMLGVLKDSMNELTPALDGLNARLKPFMEMVGGKLDGAVPSVVGRIGEAVEKAKPFLEPFADAFHEIWGALKPLAPVLAQTVAQLSPLSLLLQALGPVLPTLAGLLSQVGTALASSLGTTLTALQPSLLLVSQMLADTAAQVLPMMLPMIEQLGGLLAQLLPSVLALVPPIVELAAQLLTALAPIFSELAASILPPVVSLLVVLVDALLPLVEMIVAQVVPAIESLVPVVEAAFAFIGDVISVAVQYVTGTLQAWIQLFQGDWSGAWETAKATLGAAWSGIKSAFRGYIDGMLSGWKSALSDLVSRWVEKWNTVKERVSNILPGIKTAVSNGIGEVVAFFTGLPQKIKDAFPNPLSILKGIGSSIMDGLKNGIESGFGKVKDSLNWLTDKLPDWKGPKKKDSKLLTPAGETIMKGFVKGLESGYEAVKKSLTAFTNDLAKYQKNAVKVEADRLIEARRQENRRIKAENAKLAKGQKKQALKPALTRAEAEKQAKKNVRITAKGLKSAQKLIDAQGKYSRGLWAGGTTKGAKSVLGTLTAKVDKNDSSAWAKATRLRKNSFTQADVGRAQDYVAAQLSTAKKTLADLRKARADLKAQVADSIRGELDLTAGIGQDSVVNGHTVKGKTTFASVAGQVKSLAAKAKAFAGKLQALVKKGIPAGLVQEIAGLGTENGIKVANALLSGSKAQVKSLASDYASLNSWSSKAGDHVAGQMYDVGIDAQLGLIKGLESNSKKLEAAAKSIAKKLEKAVRKELDTHSPSKKFFAIGTDTMDGLELGVESRYSAVENSLSGFAGGLASTSFDSPVLGVSSGVAGGRSLSDADIEALALALSQVQVRWVPSDREVGRLAQRGARVLERSRS